MSSIQTQLTQKFSHALVAAFGDEFSNTDPLVVLASNPKFGDYQSNIALSLTKPLQKNPMKIAQEICDRLEISNFCESPEIAKPGFINLTLKPDYLATQLATMASDRRLGVEKVKQPQKVIVDFSSPNIAKEMHVGHLRSTIIGDSIARILEFRGHDVLRLNHVGDWGTQFGMLIAYLRETHPEALMTANALDLGNLVTLYRQAKKQFDEDEAFQETARQEVVRLQSGAEDSRHAWQLLCEQSRQEFQQIYDRLDISLQERGESFYNPLLPGVVEHLDSVGLLEENEGAKCVFLEGFTNKEGDRLPLIVQKTDGGFNYATTDLAALQYRTGKDEADRIIYVTDAGQGNHFVQVFQVARKAKILPENVEVVHVPFGVVKGKDGKKLQTRAGDTVRLKDLLDEAVSRAYQDLDKRLQENNRTESEPFKENVAEIVGISAVKYADLSQNRTSEYIFNYDKMLDLKGNTVPYLLYTYVRTQGIGRKEEKIGSSALTTVEPVSIAKISPKYIQQQIQDNWPTFKPMAIASGVLVTIIFVIDAIVKIHLAIHHIPLFSQILQFTGFSYTLWFAFKHLLFYKKRQQFKQKLEEKKREFLGTPDTVKILPPAGDRAEIILQEDSELILAKHLLQLTDVLAEVERDLYPNRLCQYLYELSQKFNQFFENCPVLKAEEPVRTSRLMLCDLTARTLKQGLSLLGISVLERM
ncbi:MULTISPECIES: arginine--tRNA ligase [Spirulina sp. CCY15215]|uniref:arginine--tRNA ligase n=1 Tax=Spirulina sp. CCY15215 TaxID=2767591 RepID=UPI0019500B10|nr:arginine--tRNA ligase [Spirulina major]